MCQGFSSLIFSYIFFIDILHHFVLAKLATRSIRVKSRNVDTDCQKCFFYTLRVGELISATLYKGNNEKQNATESMQISKGNQQWSLRVCLPKVCANYIFVVCFKYGCFTHIWYKIGSQCPLGFFFLQRVFLPHSRRNTVSTLGVHTVKIIRYGTGTVYFIRF